MSTRIAIVVLSALLLSHVARLDTRHQAAVSHDPTVTIEGASVAQRQRMSVALARFAAAGLLLPDLEIVFSDEKATCGERLGVFRDTEDPWQIIICSELDFVFEHELAHAWERANLNEETRRAFMDLRGHSVWSDASVEWNERAIEGVAFVIQWGVSGPPLASTIGPEASSRLEAYELLTRRPAPVLVDFIESRVVPCAERPTPLSRSVADVDGASCGPVRSSPHASHGRFA